MKKNMVYSKIENVLRGALLILMVVVNVGVWGQTVIEIGSGTSSDRYPLGSLWGYERSASLYTAAEIGQAGDITKVAWYGTVNYQKPVKIYIGTTSESTLTSKTVAQYTANMTLVNDGTANPYSNQWGTFTLSTPFAYNGTDNLIVLVETNYGGNGNGSGANIKYSVAPNKHVVWYADGSEPQDNGGTSSSRPDIKLTIEVMSTYCVPTFTNQIHGTYGDQITNVKIVGEESTILNNNSSSPTPSSNYSDYTGLAPVKLLAGSNYILEIQDDKTGQPKNERIKMWIDFDENSIFNESNENLVDYHHQGLDESSGAPYTTEYGFSIPSSVQAGVYRMRVFMAGMGPSEVIDYDACGNWINQGGKVEWGEVEDYLVEIIMPTLDICDDITSMQCGIEYQETLHPNSGSWTNYTNVSHNYTGSEKVWSFTPSITGDYHFYVGEGNADADFFLMSDCDNTSTNIPGTFWSGINFNTANTVTLTGGVTYYLIADLYENASSSTTVTVKVDKEGGCEEDDDPCIVVDYTPVSVSGFNEDVIANGSGVGTSSTTAPIDERSNNDQNYALVAESFVNNWGNYLGNDGVINNNGKYFELQDYDGYNSLRLGDGNSDNGTLVFDNHKAAEKVYILSTSGAGHSYFKAEVKFEDNTSQTFIGLISPDWYNEGNTLSPVIQGIGRIRRDVSSGGEGSGSSPSLFEAVLPISSSNQHKKIKEIEFTKTSGGILNILAISILPSEPNTFDCLPITVWLKAEENVNSTSQKVTEWISVSGSADNYTVDQSTSSKQPAIIDGATDYKQFNYHRRIKFDANNSTELKNDDQVFDIIETNGAMFAVFDRNNTPNNTGLSYKYISSRSFQLKPSFRLQTGDIWFGTTVDWGEPEDSHRSSASLIYGSGFNTQLSARVNSKTLPQEFVDDDTYRPSVSYGLHIGSKGGDEFVNSSVAEVIFTDESVTTNEIHIIESYLSLKYGITRGNNPGTSTDYNYLASDGSTVFNKTANTGYNNDIAGIGRDDGSTLNQKQSISVNIGEPVTIAIYPGAGKAQNEGGKEIEGEWTTKGTGFIPADNLANTATFDNDRSFLVWGNNGLPTETDFANESLKQHLPASLGGDAARIERIWKAQATNFSQRVAVGFESSMLVNYTSIDNLVLLVGTSPSDWTGATVYGDAVLNGNRIEFGGVTLGDKDFFTLATIKYSETPLPVELTSFAASCENNETVVRWTTATELNSESYSLEFSRDGQNWNSIAYLAGAGNTSSTTHYQVNDVLNNEGYYRLVQRDFDGEETVYGPISSSCGSFENGMTVYPNPTGGEFVVELTTDQLMNDLVIAVYDLAGRVVAKQTTTVHAGINKVYFNTTNFASGTYTLAAHGGTTKFAPVKLVVVK